MKRILTKTNMPLLLITLCAVLLCGLFAISSFKSNKQLLSAYEEGSSSIFKRPSLQYEDFGYYIDELIITNDDNKIPSNFVEKISASDDNLLSAYIYLGADDNYDCVVHGSVEKIYAPENSSTLFSGNIVSSGNDGVMKNSAFNRLRKIQFDTFDTSNVTDMSMMFYKSSFLEEINLSSWNTEKVTNMRMMFAYAYKIQELDLSNFNTEEVTQMDSMFMMCASLTTLDVSSFNTNKIADMRMMFMGCQYLNTLDLSSFDTTNTTNMSNMFVPIRGENGYISNEGAKNFLNTMMPMPDVAPDDEFFFSKLNGIENPTTETELQAKQQFETFLGGEITDIYAIPYRITTLNISNFVINENTDTTNMLCGLENMKILVAPATCNKEISLPQTMLEQNTTNEYTILSSASNGKTLVIENAETPSTGFVDEQLLPVIAIGFLSVIVVAFIGSKRKYFNK